jgi:hypothetical protein
MAVKYPEWTTQAGKREGSQAQTRWQPIQVKNLT